MAKITQTAVGRNALGNICNRVCILNDDVLFGEN